MTPDLDLIFEGIAREVLAALMHIHLQLWKHMLAATHQMAFSVPAIWVAMVRNWLLVAVLPWECVGMGHFVLDDPTQSHQCHFWLLFLLQVVETLKFLVQCFQLKMGRCL